MFVLRKFLAICLLLIYVPSLSFSDMDRETLDVLFSSNTNTVKSLVDLMYEALRKDISDVQKEHNAEVAEP